MAVSLPRSFDLAHGLRDRLIDAFPRRATSRKLQLWRMVTLPFWFGSDVPPPMLPTIGRNPLGLPTGSPADIWLSQSIHTMTTRFWISWCVSAVLRGAALGASGAVLWSILAAVGLIASPSIWLITIFVLAGMVPGLAFGLINRPSSARVAMMIDRTFGLDERLITAIEHRTHPDNEIAIMQGADAANSMLSVLSEIRWVHLAPVRECVLLMVAVTSALAIWMFAFDARDVDALSETRVPGYYPASERLADQQGALPTKPTPSAESGAAESEEATGEISTSNDDLQDLGTLGAALDQNALTKSSAESLARGDLPGASSALDAAAGDIANASQAERDALADDLDDAADSISATNPELAEQTRETADAIRSGGPEAEQAVTDLADSIEEMAPPEAQEGDASGSESESSNTAPVGEQEPGSNSGQSTESGSSSGDATEGGASDPGSGSEAEPGIAEPPSSEGDSEGGTQPGESGSSTGEGEASGDEGSPSDAESDSGNSTSGSPDDGSGNGGDTGSSAIGDAQDETSTSQGSGAGSGQTDANDQPIEGQAPNTTEADPGSPAESEPVESETGDAPVGEAGDGGEAGSGSETIDIGGSSTDTVQSGNDTGSSSLGSGSSGAEVGSGDAMSETAGPAGPDSNHVPSDYEDIVEDYFSEPVP